MNGKHTTFFKAALAASKRVRSHKVSVKTYKTSLVSG
jgi:hypothetical protein